MIVTPTTNLKSVLISFVEHLGSIFSVHQNRHYNTINIDLQKQRRQTHATPWVSTHRNFTIPTTSTHIALNIGGGTAHGALQDPPAKDAYHSLP